MKTVNEVSKISGISVRTLHYYDEIGLLSPSGVTASGYRLYDDKAMAKLQSILLFRELEFPLKEIKIILENPEFDKTEALLRQIEMLRMRKKHIDSLISLAERIIDNEVNTMDFSAFDKTELESLANEAKRKWGGTAAYQEYQKHEQDGTTGDPADLMKCFAELGKLKHLDPAATEAQAVIRELQQFITDHFYTCTPEILAGLGEMYVADDRFRKNIDKAGGEGTAEFVAKAIRAYCGK